MSCQIFLWTDRQGQMLFLNGANARLMLAFRSSGSLPSTEARSASIFSKKLLFNEQPSYTSLSRLKAQITVLRTSGSASSTRAVSASRARGSAISPSGSSICVMTFTVCGQKREMSNLRLIALARRDEQPTLIHVRCGDEIDDARITAPLNRLRQSDVPSAQWPSDRPEPHSMPGWPRSWLRPAGIPHRRASHGP